MNFTRRQTMILAISLGVIVLLTVMIAPNSGQQRQYGSTYSRAPQGYGAWYAFMQEKGAPIQRWQRPIEELLATTDQNSAAGQSQEKTAKPATPITLIRIAEDIQPINPNHPWIKQGNVLILLGRRSPISDAPFTSDLDSEKGTIRIETRRRQPITSGQETTTTKTSAILSDRFGAIVWQETSGKGRVIYASTPYLAANAYQDFRSNFDLLATLATQPGFPIWVDEYLHGYQDAPTPGRNALQKNVWAYLLRTPLLLVAMQVIVLLLVALWGQRRRFGPPVTLGEPVMDNSKAYIQAMSSVLHRATCSEFVLETVGKAEQLEIQKQLGLGSTLLPIDTVVEAWQRRTRQSGEELRSMLRMSAQHPKLTDQELKKWIETLQRLRQAIAR